MPVRSVLKCQSGLACRLRIQTHSLSAHFRSGFDRNLPKLTAQALRGEGKFSFAFNLIWPVQSSLQKYFGSLLTQITCLSFAIPAHTEGRFAIVTDVGQGMRWTRQRRSANTLRGRTMLMRTAKSCGPDAPTLASSFAEVSAR